MHTAQLQLQRPGRKLQPLLAGIDLFDQQTLEESTTKLDNQMVTF